MCIIIEELYTSFIIIFIAQIINKNTICGITS